MPTYSSLRQNINWNLFTVAKSGIGKLTLCRFGSCEFSKRKAFGDNGTGDVCD